MIILHLCMHVSYIQYTTCNKIMEGIKKGLLLTQQSFFVVRLSFIDVGAADYGGPYIDERPTMNDFLRFIK